MTFRHLVLSACLSTSALAVASLAMPSAAQAATQSVRVEHAWSRATPGTSTEGVVYATLVASAADRLTSVSSPIAADAQLHENLTTDGVMKMRPVASLDLVPGKPVKLAPGGYHIMLGGLKAPLAAGQKFPVTFHFEKAGDVTATVAVQALGATGPAAKQGGMDMKGMDMKGMNMGNGD